jgi:uncharacterized repeat protein (TIGR02543 family)
MALLLLLLVGAAPAQERQDPPKIAVYVTGNVAEDEKKALGTRMLATLINSGRYKGIERSNSFLSEIEKEQAKQRSGAIDDNQISELGRQFGVKFVCIADITPAFGEYQVSARVIDVETAEVVFIGESFSPLKSSADLVAVSNQVVKNMFGDQAGLMPITTYTVAVTVNPASGGYVHRSIDKMAYDAGEVLTLTATANSGYAFAGWSGASSSANAVLTGPVTGDLALTANFRSLQQGHTLTTIAAPSGGGSIIRSPDKESYAAGEEVKVSATSADGYKFTGWTGAVTSRKNLVTVKMNGDKTLTANFYQKSLQPPIAQKPEAKPKPERQESGGGVTFGVGAGLFYTGDFAGGIQWSDGGILGMPYNAGGAYLFLDATYAAVSLGYSQGGGKWETPNSVNPNDLPYMSRAMLNIGVSVKYPNLINVTVLIADKEKHANIYPTAGIDYDFPVSAKLEFTNAGEYAFDGGNKDGYNADALSAVWVKFGAGLDFYLTEKAFIRAELLYGARMSNRFEIDKTNAYNADAARLGSGMTFKAGAGFGL